MADDVNPDAGQQPEDANPNMGDGIENSKGSDDGQPDAVRKLQSDRDRTKAENAKLQERLDALEGQVGMSAKNQAISEYLEANKDKYPDVDKNDLQYASSVEEIEELAKSSQARADRIRNKTLQDLQNVPADTLSQEEYDKQIAELEQEVEKTGKSGFAKFLDLKSKRR